MAVSNVTSTAASYLSGSSNPYQSVQTTYNQFQQSVTSGNLPGAQQVYTSLVKALQNSPIGQADSAVSTPVLNSLVNVATALQSGDLSQVQTALTSLGQSINTAAQGAAGSSSSSGSSSALSPQQLTATLVSQIMNTMSGGGSDSLLAAMNGNTSSSSSATTDPMLQALSGSNSSSGTSTTDPLLQALTSGVNIVV
jgi:hypothetical protein